MKYLTFLAISAILIIHLFILSKLQFTAWPEMFSYPYLFNNGFSLYKDFIYPYPPMLVFILSIVFKIFGFNILVLKTITWILILLSSVLVYKTANLLTKNKILSLMSMVLYAALQPFLEGNMLWFDLAIVPLVLAGAIFSLKYLENNSNLNLIFAGLFFALASLTKQTTALYIIIFVGYLIFKRVSYKKILYFLSLPFILMSLLFGYLVYQGSLVEFLNWTVIYPLTLWSKFPGYVQMTLSKRDTFTLIAFFLFLLPLLFNIKLLKDIKLKILLCFLMVALLSIYPRFSYFHFQSALCFFIIVGIYLMKSWSKLKTYLLLCGVLSLLAILQLKTVVWGDNVRFYEADDKKLAISINKITKTDDKILLIGQHSGIYVLANRLPPVIWSDNFGWYLEIPGVQKKIEASWSDDPPKLIVRKIPKDGNWYDLSVYQPKELISYLKDRYSLIKNDEHGEWWLRNEGK